MTATNYPTVASSQRPAAGAAADSADATAGGRWVRLTIGRSGSLYRVLIHDSGAARRPEASAIDHTWQLALIHARDRAASRGIAADAEGASLLAEAIAECEAAMAARQG